MAENPFDQFDITQENILSPVVSQVITEDIKNPLQTMAKSCNRSFNSSVKTRNRGGY